MNIEVFIVFDCAIIDEEQICEFCFGEFAFKVLCCIFYNFGKRLRMYIVDSVIERTLLEKLCYSREIYSILTLVTDLSINPFYDSLLLLNKRIIIDIIIFAELHLLIKNLCVLLVHFSHIIKK